MGKKTQVKSVVAKVTTVRWDCPDCGHECSKELKCVHSKCFGPFCEDEYFTNGECPKCGRPVEIDILG